MQNTLFSLQTSLGNLIEELLKHIVRLVFYGYVNTTTY